MTLKNSNQDQDLKSMTKDEYGGASNMALDLKS